MLIVWLLSNDEMNLDVVAVILVDVLVTVLPAGGWYRPTFDRQRYLYVFTSSHHNVLDSTHVNARLLCHQNQSQYFTTVIKSLSIIQGLIS